MKNLAITMLVAAALAAPVAANAMGGITMEARHKHSYGSSGRCVRHYYRGPCHRHYKPCCPQRNWCCPKRCCGC